MKKRTGKTSLLIGMFVVAFIVLTSFKSFSLSPVAIQPYKLKTVVIDPGHGGHDHGCSGSKNNEKTVALNLSLKLGELIEKNYPDVKVVYTRKTDVFIELHERAAIANRNNADLFICIHCNANPSSSPFGTETYVMGLHKTEANLNVAKRENDVILLEDNYNQHYDGFDPSNPASHIIFSLNQHAFMEQSILFASSVEKYMKSHAKRSSRGVKQAGFLVLWKTGMPSVLIETGFLTNANEEKFLGSSEDRLGEWRVKIYLTTQLTEFLYLAQA
ncbi:MAG TPA: N-acetylmuramoyl-L-alanine amidase [Chitinophagales bacterium]|nr:N-acetylmuramoyl-L-alanine amidase [Chitinophagales bacterium]